MAMAMEDYLLASLQPPVNRIKIEKEETLVKMVCFKVKFQMFMDI